jgi:predicted nucleic acid-binding protein
MTLAYVVDTSVVIQRFIAEAYTPNVRVLFSQLSQGIDLVVPEFCLLECTNVFWRQVRFQGMSQTDAEQFIDQLGQIPFEIVPAPTLMSQALQIGLSKQLAIYDSIYIALALNRQCSLITVDERQVKAAITTGVTSKPISDFAP